MGKMILCLLVTFFGWVPNTHGENAFDEIKIDDNLVIQPGLNCIEVFGRHGKTGKWKTIPPSEFVVEVTGNATFVKDPSHLPTNPFVVNGVGETEGQAHVAILYRNAIRYEKKLRVVKMEAQDEVTVLVDPDKVLHQFDGFGGGVMFYDNQWDLSDGDEIYNWCFRDVKTTFLRVLIRPVHESVNDNNDWRQLDPKGFDFSSAQRAFRIIRKAKELRPELKIYANLYSPPGWMKTNNSFRGDGTLQQDHEQEMAEYLFAWLREAETLAIPIDYLSIFNEPDYQHSQDGMHFREMRRLVECFDKTTQALKTLCRAADQELPKLIFPDVLGSGSITRTPGIRPVFQKASKMLSERVDVWGVHDYWDSGDDYWDERFLELRQYPGVRKKPIWMTEWAQRSPKGDLGSAFNYGLTILNAIRNGAQAWMVFEWCHPAENQSGLISCDWSTTFPRPRSWRSKSYHLFRQIANTTPAGSHIVGSNLGTNTSENIEHLAVVESDQLIVHLFNGNTYPIKFHIRLPARYSLSRSLITTPNRTAIETFLVPATVPASTLLTLDYDGHIRREN